MKKAFLVMEKWLQKPFIPQSAHSSLEAAQERIEQLKRIDAKLQGIVVDYRILEVPLDPQEEIKKYITSRARALEQ